MTVNTCTVHIQENKSCIWAFQQPSA